MIPRLFRSRQFSPQIDGSHKPRTSLKRFPRRRAVTLMELTVCILLIGIAAAMAIPRYILSLNRFRAESAASRIVQDIRLAQRTARQTNSARTISFSTTTDDYSIASVVSMDRSTDTYSVKLKDTPYVSDLISITDSTQSGANLTSVSLKFDRFGTPDRGVTLNLRSGDQSRTVTVQALTGKVSSQ